MESVPIKKIAIYYNSVNNIDIQQNSKYIIKISNLFITNGYAVYLFIKNNGEIKNINERFKIFDSKEILNACNNIGFDYVFLNESLKGVNEITNCENVYYISHNSIIYNFDFSLISKLSKIICCSDFSKNELISKYHIPENKIIVINDFIDNIPLYDTFLNYSGPEFKTFVSKRNKMTYSGSNKNGLRWLIEHVFPKIKSEVRDFELYVCCDESIKETELDGVYYLRSVPKSEIIKKQCESKIWICPNHGYNNSFDDNNSMFYDDAIENMAAKNACILGDWGCISSIFKNYDGFVGKYLYKSKNEPIDYDKLEDFAEELATEAIKCLKDEEYRQNKVKQTYEISFNYNSENTIKNFEKMFENEERKNIKTLLCCIGRLENKYIREFVEYYKYLGFTKICLYDNNREGEEDFRDVIGDYINNGFVILKDKRNIKEPCQLQSYNECYNEYKNDYNWIAFFDIDEFLIINKNIKINDYLSNEIFDDYDMIHVNWFNFGDGGNAYYEDKPLFERIKKPIDINSKTNYNFPDNFHIKSIVRGKINKRMIFNSTPHTPYIEGKCCNATGLECNGNSPFNPYDYRNAALIHFTTKTAEEFANKVNRGFCDGNQTKKEAMIEQFFVRNEVTKEKINIFKEKCGIDMGYLLSSEFNGEKNNDIKIFSLCYAKKNFKFLDDSVVTPLQVGSANGTDVCKLKDNTGDNISDLNYFYIENTGIYWIWKNINGAKYKGQMQYRRPLEGVDETMDFDKIFEDYDVITCKPFNHPENSKPTKEQPMCIPANTVEEGYAFSNCRDDLSLMEMLIKYRFPEYAEDYDKYIKNGENLYYSNGFIMKSDDYDKYCEFLFECLGLYLKSTNIKTKDDLEKHVKYNIETGKYIRYKGNQVSPEAFKWQTEIGGFLSERIWTLWLLHNFKKERIYELPYIKMENNMYT